MSMEWYDMIARRNGGYRARAQYIWEGKSAEEMFEERLIQLLPAYTSVLDAGCGHGDFTLKMAAHATHITGFPHPLLNTEDFSLREACCLEYIRMLPRFVNGWNVTFTSRLRSKNIMRHLWFFLTKMSLLSSLQTFRVTRITQALSFVNNCKPS
ncbi:SAM-dependent methyltransferase [Paenibacillus intestini]|nr:SAM-dependent methyltransferase [Paenibacillus intestini]